VGSGAGVDPPILHAMLTATMSVMNHKKGFKGLCFIRKLLLLNKKIIDGR
jgi:hypothetical protein